DGFDTRGGKTHGHLHVGAGPLPSPHLADAERSVAQLRPHLQPRGAAVIVILDADLPGRMGAPRGRRPARPEPVARRARPALHHRVIVARPSPTPGPAPPGVAVAVL